MPGLWPPEGFEPRKLRTAETVISAAMGGKGPPLLLLHGFPQTSLMWRGVAPVLATDFTVVCADLRGYGDSGHPASAPDHAPYAKRAMARDMVEAMHGLGFSRFAIAGHDRGGRVAYRLTLDHPEAVSAAAVLDVLPTAAVWARADARTALAFWPWSLLAQPAPLPERLLADLAEAVVDNALDQWGSPGDAFPAKVRAAYAAALRAPDAAHSICEEYRAAASLDREHDEADWAAGRRIESPLLVLWSAGGGLDTWYADEGGPLAIWRDWAHEVSGGAIEGGHFFPEAAPVETAAALREFFLANARSA